MGMITDKEAEEFASYGLFRQKKSGLSHMRFTNTEPYVTYVNIHNWMYININRATGAFQVCYDSKHAVVVEEHASMSKEALVGIVGRMEVVIAQLNKLVVREIY